MTITVTFPVRTEPKATTRTSCLRSVLELLRLTFAVTALFHRTCTEPQMEHFVTTSQTFRAYTPVRFADLPLTFVQRAIPP